MPTAAPTPPADRRASAANSSTDLAQDKNPSTSHWRLSHAGWLAHGLLAAGPLAAQVASPPAHPPTDDELLHLPSVQVQAQPSRSVSSPKFTAPLIDTPQTVAVVPSEVFNAQGATTLSDVLRNTPGITFAAGEGGSVAAGDAFYLRGVDTSDSIFVDGVRDSGAYSRDTYNLDQVEIAKGPAGADTGRSGASGYVNLATKTPQLVAARTAQLTLNESARGEPQRRATLDLNQPLSDHVAVRLAAVDQDSGVPGRDFIKNANRGISPSVALGLGTDTRLILAGSFDHADNLPDAGMPVQALPGVILPGGSPVAVAQSNQYGLAVSDFDRTDRTSVMARLDHNCSGSLRVTNQTMLINTDRDAITSYFQNSNTTPTTFAPATTPVNPATGTTPPAFTSYDPTSGLVTPRRIHNQSANRILSNQTNFAAPFATGSVNHSASAGLELSREEQATPTWQAVAGPATSLLDPVPNRTVTAAETPYRASNLPFANGRIDTVALYAFDSLQLSPRLHLNLGLRWESYGIDYFVLDPATPAVPVPTVTHLFQRQDVLSGKTGFVFKPAASGSLYVAFANTATPPGSTFVFSSNATNANNPNLKPQVARNGEVGAKWEFLNQRLAANLALYRSENFNTGSIDAVTGLVTQDISQTVQGVEFGLSGRITPDWFMFGGFGYIDTSAHTAGTTAAADDGADLRFTPRLSGNLWTTYALNRHLTVGSGLQYSDSVVRSTSNHTPATATTINTVPPSWLVNLLAAWAVNAHLTVRLNLNNALNVETYRLNNNGGRYYPGATRNLLLTATWKF